LVAWEKLVEELAVQKKTFGGEEEGEIGYGGSCHR
jgi:hypothetical protein